MRLPDMKTFVLRSVLNGLRWSGAAGLFARCCRWDGVVFMLHRVRPRSDAPFQPNGHLEVTPEFLDAVLTHLKEQRIEVISLSDAAARMRGEGSGSGRFAVLTFDDGYRDNLDHALPILQKHRAPATVYVCSGMIDGTANCWWLLLERAIAENKAVDLDILGHRYTCDCADERSKNRAFSRLLLALRSAPVDEQRRVSAELCQRYGLDMALMLKAEMLDWQGVRDLATSGLVTVSGHSRTHASLAGLSASLCREEIVGGCADIEQQTGQRVVDFAYPFGRNRNFGRREMAFVRQAGLQTAVSSKPGFMRSGETDLLAIPRISLNGHYQSIAYVDVLLSGLPAACARLTFASLR